MGVYDFSKKNGLFLFPLLPDIKVPYRGMKWRDVHIDTKELFSSVTSHPKYKGCNFGVNCGKSGVIVVDLDVKDNKDGIAAWRDIVTMHGGAPDTLTVTTPSGGEHLYFKGQGSNSAGKLGEGIDIRAAGGYVVAPSSTVGGGMYRITTDAPIAEAPTWLLDLVRRSEKLRNEVQPDYVDDPSTVQYAGEWLVEEAEPAIEGAGGDLTTLQVAMQLRDYGLSESKAYDLMEEHYNSRCAPPWEPVDLYAKVHNAYAYASNDVGVANALCLKEADVSPYETPKFFGKTSSSIRINRFSDDVRRGDALGKPVPLLGDFLFEDDLAILFASTNVGKSLLAMQWSIGLASGEWALGLACGSDPKRVLYCDYELSDRQLASRYNADSMPDELYRLSLNPESLDFASGRKIATLIAQGIEETNAEVVVVDNVTYLSDETTDAKEAITLMKLLKFIKIKYGVTMLVIAHTPKRKDSKSLQIGDLSGSANLGNFVDSVFALGRTAFSPSVRYLKQLKTRSSALMDFVYSVQIDRDARNNLVFLMKGQASEEEMLTGKETERTVEPIRTDTDADVVRAYIATMLVTDEAAPFEALMEELPSVYPEKFPTDAAVRKVLNSMTEGAAYVVGDTYFELVNDVSAFREAFPNWRERKFYRSSKFFRKILF